MSSLQLLLLLLLYSFIYFWCLYYHREFHSLISITTSTQHASNPINYDLNTLCTILTCLLFYLFIILFFSYSALQSWRHNLGTDTIVDLHIIILIFFKKENNVRQYCLKSFRCKAYFIYFIIKGQIKWSINVNLVQKLRGSS